MPFSRTILFWISVVCLVINGLMVVTELDNPLTPYVMLLLLIGAWANRPGGTNRG